MNEEKLFYQGINNKSQVTVINKRQIESASQTANLEVTFKMVSGDTIVLNMDATMYGQLLFQLSEIRHANEQEAKP